MNLPICVSLHFCGTATVPPIWKTFRARSVATVNTADFSAGPEIKLERTLWDDNAAGPKIEAQISSILPRTSVRSPGESTSVYSQCKARSSTCSYKLGGEEKISRFPHVRFDGQRRQTSDRMLPQSKQGAGTWDLLLLILLWTGLWSAATVWTDSHFPENMRTRFHLSPGHPLSTPTLCSAHPPLCKNQAGPSYDAVP